MSGRESFKIIGTSILLTSWMGNDFIYFILFHSIPGSWY